MSEADLQRLAEIIIQLSPKDGTPWWDIFGYLVTFLSGIALSRLEFWHAKSREDQRLLKPSREQLYRVLIHYRDALHRVARADVVNENNSRTATDIYNGKLQISQILRQSDDRKYSRLCADIVHSKSQLALAERIEELDSVIKKLEKDALPIFEVLTEQDRVAREARRERDARQEDEV